MFDRYSVIDMFGPFYGENWHPAEIAEGLTFRWSGPEPRSSLRAPTLGARDLRLRWTLSILPQEHQLAELEWMVGGQRMAPQWAMRSGYATLWADVHLAEPEQAIEVSLAVPRRLRAPLDDPDDARALGLAVHKFEVFALDADALGAEARRLRAELDARERDMSSLLNSTSWKLSRPLRWFKENMGGASSPQGRRRV